jgi:hypothetical protein
VTIAFHDDAGRTLAIWSEDKLQSPQVFFKEPKSSMSTHTSFTSIKDVSAPARRALAAAGYDSLEQLDGVSERQLAKLHGMGPNALRALKAALAAKQMELKE